jgi:glutathione gamma-glutamylcysteinyltransferase
MERTVTQTTYRRPLPENAVAFASAEGRALFSEALSTKGLDGYFPLAEQYHTQSEPTFCGLGSLVVALNALAIDPERSWKGPWRWFSEELLDCCSPLAAVRERGLDMEEFVCLARCNGADVELHRADASSFQRWRAALASAASGEAVVIAAYDRAAIGQTGGGHYSPLGGYHATKNLVLMLDVARFKYPAHWMDANRLWQAMQRIDPATNQARGWIVLRPSAGRRTKCAKP